MVLVVPRRRAAHIPQLELLRPCQQRAHRPLGHLVFVVLGLKGQHCTTLALQFFAPVGGLEVELVEGLDGHHRLLALVLHHAIQLAAHHLRAPRGGGGGCGRVEGRRRTETSIRILVGVTPVRSL
jgi:hypothetical protein